MFMTARDWYTWLYTDSATTRSLKGPEGEQVEGGSFSSLPIQTPNFSWAEPNTLN